MKKALVTGATGFVGSHVAELLLERGWSVRCLHRASSDLRNIPAGAETVAGDLKDLPSLRHAVQGVDEVFHVAADYRFWSAHADDLYESNVKGTENIMTAALEARVGKVVYTSTVGTIGLAYAPMPCNERTPLKEKQMLGHYKASKYDAEKKALEFVDRGLNVVVVNPSTPIGARDIKPTPTGKIIVDFCNGKMPAYIATGLNFVDVKDVAMGHLLASEKGRAGERYILGGRNLSMKEFLEILAEVSGRKAPCIQIPYGIAYTAGWFSTRLSDFFTKKEPAVALQAVKMAKNYMYFDSAKAVRELGYNPKAAELDSVKAAVLSAYRWYQKEKYVSL